MTRFGGIVLAMAALGLASARSMGEPDLPAVLRLDAGVKDPVFAVLIGMLESDTYGTLSRDRLEAEIARQPGRSRLPYRQLRDLLRVPVRPGEARVVLRFASPLDQPIPYSILGYHPGSFGASATCVFREWVVSAAQLSEPPARLEDVHLFLLAEGRLWADIDGWLDFLMGPALDDTDVGALAVFRHEGRWKGMALGRNTKGVNRSGAFDFAADRIVFPPQDEMRAVSRRMRAALETLAGVHD